MSATFLRNDGKHTIFTIEIEGKDGGWYTQIGMAENAQGAKEHGAIVIKGLRFGDKHDGKMEGESSHDYSEFQASGRCWRMLGIHGTFNIEVAVRLAAALATSNTDRKFRVVRTVVEQSTIIVANLCFPSEI